MEKKSLFLLDVVVRRVPVEYCLRPAPTLHRGRRKQQWVQSRASQRRRRRKLLAEVDVNFNSANPPLRAVRGVSRKRTDRGLFAIFCFPTTVFRSATDRQPSSFRCTALDSPLFHLELRWPRGFCGIRVSPGLAPCYPCTATQKRRGKAA